MDNQASKSSGNDSYLVNEEYKVLKGMVYGITLAALLFWIPLGLLVWAWLQ